MWKRLMGLGRASDAVSLAGPMVVCIAASALAATGLVVYGESTVSLVAAGAIVVAAAVMIFQTQRVVSHFGRQSRTLRRAATQAEQHYVNVLRQIVRIVEGRDRYTSGHSERVGLLASRIAAQLHLDEEQCRQLYLAGQLHDIGLLAVSDEVLTKRGMFNAGDQRAVQKHSEVSFELLQPMDSLADILEAIRYHHERLNGTGYPDGLKGEEIPLEARILAVADSYEAMTHDRPHRPGMAPLAAMEELRRCVPSGYDGRCVEALAEIVHLPELREIRSLVETAPEAAAGAALT